MVNLNDYFSYDSITGIVTWKIVVLGGGEVGEEVGSLNSKGYRRVYLFDKHYYVHRLAWFLYYGFWPDGYIDHINGNAADNRLENLREATPAQNTFNKKKSINNTSGVKGISWHKRDKKWQAALECNNKMIFVGYFKNLDDAKDAIEKRRLELHEEFTNHG